MNRIALIGKKVGMTSFFIDNVLVPITVIKIDKNYFLGEKSYDEKRSILISTFPKKEKNIGKCANGVFKKLSIPACSLTKEFEIPNDFDLSTISVGHSFAPSDSMIGLFVDARSISKGKGFQGGMKRWGFSGMPASHGVSVSHRALGSTGQRTLPGKVWKGKKMPGQMGAKNKCVKNLKIIKVDINDGLIFLKGSVPGSENSTVHIVDAHNYRTSSVSRSINGLVV